MSRRGCRWLRRRQRWRGGVPLVRRFRPPRVVRVVSVGSTGGSKRRRFTGGGSTVVAARQQQRAVRRRDRSAKWRHGRGPRLDRKGSRAVLQAFPDSAVQSKPLGATVNYIRPAGVAMIRDVRPRVSGQIVGDHRHEFCLQLARHSTISEPYCPVPEARKG